MQITIVQAEIEQAIRNYIQDQIMVKDGMQIDITLKATRGEEGTTALIDIVPVKSAPAAKKSEPKAEVAITKSVASAPVKKEEPKQEEASQGNEQQPPFEPGEPQGVTSGDTPSTVTTSTETAGPGNEPASTEPQGEAPAADGEAPAEPKRTLFAGLKRVNNG